MSRETGFKHSEETKAKMRAARARQSPPNADPLIKARRKERLAGNQFRLTLKTAQEKWEAFEQYCQWIAQGNSSRSWSYDHPTIKFCGKAMENQMHDNPNDFPPEVRDVALAKSQALWEAKGEKMMMGKVKNCQPAVFQMFMRNKFGWDKESQILHTVEPEVRKLLKKWEEEG